MSAAVPGTVYLVGAGPGDPGLLTARALELLATADVVLHDKLIPAEALDGVRADAEVVDVGKIGGGEQVPQDVTEDLVAEHARAGRSVVRLKGGDPFVFGRGGEEAQRCVAEGIPFEVVPGVTAGVAASAYAGIPVTQRRISAAVAFVTGHEDPDKPETQIDWPALAAFPGTLVFYMGVRRLGHIAERLVARGLADHPDRREISLLAISVSNLVDQPVLQLELPIDADTPDGGEVPRAGSRVGSARWAVDTQIDAIRQKFGRSAVGYTSTALSNAVSVPDEFRELAEHEL